MLAGVDEPALKQAIAVSERPKDRSDLHEVGPRAGNQEHFLHMLSRVCAFNCLWTIEPCGLTFRLAATHRGFLRGQDQ